MSIDFQILGAPGRDNALFVRVDTGQATTRLLFDCGENCLAPLSVSEIQAIDQVFFSHLHMDHVGGFDTLFRALYARTTPPNVIWGPPESGRIFQHRFQGYLWNLHEGMHATWRVNEVHSQHIAIQRFELAEAFAMAHPEESAERGPLLLDLSDCTIEVATMDHRTPSLAYVVRENPRFNVEPDGLSRLGLRPGPWLKVVKELTSDATSVEIEGTSHDLQSLRDTLLVPSPVDSIAYLTDFLLDDVARDTLLPMLKGVGTMVCESQYLHQDLDLALRNHHMTARQVAELARDAHVNDLVLFHVSDRYQPAGWQTLLNEARAVFPATRFADHWNLPRPEC